MAETAAIQSPVSEVDFSRDLREEILRTLPFDDRDPRVVAALAAMPLHDLAIRLLNWLDRFIHPHPRTIFRSRELASSSYWAEHRNPAETLLSKIERGLDVSRHLSARTQIGFALPSKKTLHQRRDLDLLLNEWGVHHLHLSEINGQGFAKEPDALLFAIFNERSAFILDILPHRQWTNERLVEVAVRNWPEAGLFHGMQSVLPAQPDVTAEQRRNLRGNGYTSAVQVDGRMYISSKLGISSAGIALRTTRQAAHILHRLRQMEEQLRADPQCLRLTFESIGVGYPHSPSFRIRIVNGPTRYAVTVFEENTQTSIAL